MDAQFQGTGIPLPATAILDYMYGVAAYKRWMTEPGQGVVENHYREHYASIPEPPRRPPSHDGDPSSEEPHDLKKDSNHRLPTSPQRRRNPLHKEGGCNGESSAGGQHECLSEELHHKRRVEEEAREASRSKVVEWIKNYGRRCSVRSSVCDGLR